MTPERIMDELLYRSYASERERAPHISPETWAKYVTNVPEMERRYQQSINDYANAGVKRDQLARHEGRDDQDMSASHGTPLKAGS